MKTFNLQGTTGKADMASGKRFTAQLPRVAIMTTQQFDIIPSYILYKGLFDFIRPSNLQGTKAKGDMAAGKRLTATTSSILKSCRGHRSGS